MDEVNDDWLIRSNVLTWTPRDDTPIGEDWLFNSGPMVTDIPERMQEEA